MRVLILTVCFLRLNGFVKAQQLPMRAGWQSVYGNTYENDMGQFTLTVPSVGAHGWFVTDELMKENPAILGTLGILDDRDVVISIQRYQVATAKQEADFLNSQFPLQFEAYKKVSQESLKIDGRAAIALSFRTVLKSDQPGKNEGETAKMTVFLIEDRGMVLGFMCLVPEKVAIQFDPIVRAVVTSFHHRNPR